MSIVDVPSPIDFRAMSDALEWERTAMLRPHREEFFDAIVERLEQTGCSTLWILERGSGPGFLASHVLSRLPSATMHLLDFSASMHELARRRLAGFAGRVSFIERDFKREDWTNDLTAFDAVVTVQAVHELRHKAYAADFHRAVRALLNDGGQYLVCDHYCGEGAMSNDQLYMTSAEQRCCLAEAGFEVTEVLVKGGRVLFHAC